MKRKWRVLTALLLLGAVGIVAWKFWRIEYGFMPSADQTLNASPIRVLEANDLYDLWGETVSEAELPADRQGAVPINGDVLQLGREMMYRESFGSEVFLTDMLGMLNGPLTLPNMMKAIMELRGAGTDNLRVELAQDITLGGRTYRKGEKIDTGLDVAKGSYTVLGMPLKWSDGKIKVGISCMACHATVDRETKMVIEGAPNVDLNAGLLMALATNSVHYFTHTDVQNVAKYMKNAEALEKAVDEVLVKWPRGSFDTTIDLESNPVQIPDSFTKGGHPYGWSGFAMAGPFHGLSVLNNNVHAQNSDPLAQAYSAPELFGIDKDTYLRILLQNAASKKYQYDPASGLTPSEFFERVDPTPGAPGVNELVIPPSYPKFTIMAPDGLVVSSPGFRFAEQVNAMSAYQNTLRPPAVVASKEERTAIKKGEVIFRKAQCISCHAGDAFTNHRIIPANVIGTEPSRAKAFKNTGRKFGEALIYSFDTPVPVPRDGEVMRVPTEHLDPEQIRLAYAHGDSPGGYKVKGLIGLRWTAPYLHDGGVAVGPKLSQLGIPGTLDAGVLPDPANSLRALVDRELRRKVVEANRSDPRLASVHVSGEGHEFWVDAAAGFTQEEQDALVRYLLSLTGR